MVLSPNKRLAHWRASRIWLRRPHRALALLGPPAAHAGLDCDRLGLRAWLTLTCERDAAEAERLAREALRRPGDLRFATASLAEALLRERRHGEAIEALRAARARLPHVPWYTLTLADALEDARRPEEAVALLEEAAAQGPPLRRHALKRLSRMALERQDAEAARRWFGALIDLAPDYLVYASDYVTLGRLQLEAGERQAALETWRRGARLYPRNPDLRELRAQHFEDVEPLAEARIAPVSEHSVGATRMPVRTPMINLRTDLGELIAVATEDRRQPGDVIAIAESATAAAQGRIVPLELMRPGALARLLSRFVGKIGPLHSHEGMQGAIMEAGRPRVVVAAVAGATGRLLGRRGWFYRVAGPRTAMIDDVAAALPPHDHHLLFGPDDVDRLSQELADGLGCEVAVVDANHLTGAWVLGGSRGVDREWLARALADNPAGNEDEQTPLVIVRPHPASLSGNGGAAQAGAAPPAHAPAVNR